MKPTTDYKRANFKTINNKLAEFFVTFQSSYVSRIVNANWELYKNALLNLKNQYIPTILVKSDNSNHWFNKRLKLLLNRKKCLYRTTKASNNLGTWDQYHLCVKQYLTKLSGAQKKFQTSDLLSILRTNPNKFYHLLSNKSSPKQIELADWIQRHPY